MKRAYRKTRLIKAIKVVRTIKRKIIAAKHKFVFLKSSYHRVALHFPGSPKAITLRKAIAVIAKKIVTMERKLHKAVTVKLAIKILQTKKHIQKWNRKANTRYIKWINYRRVHPHNRRSRRLRNKFNRARRHIQKLKNLVKQVALKKSERKVRRQVKLYKRQKKRSASFRRKFLRATKRGHNRRARIYRKKWIRAHKKLLRLWKLYRKSHVKHLNKKINKWRKALRRLHKKEKRIRRAFMRAYNSPRRARRLRKLWKRVRRHQRRIRKIVYVARRKRLTLKIIKFTRKVKCAHRKMMKFLRGWKLARKRGHLTIAQKLRRKFHFYQRKVRKFKVYRRRFVQRRRMLKIRWFKKLWMRNGRKARRLRRMYVIVRARSHGYATICVTVLRRQWRKAMRLVRKYKHIFAKLRAKYHRN